MLILGIILPACSQQPSPSTAATPAKTSVSVTSGAPATVTVASTPTNSTPAAVKTAPPIIQTGGILRVLNTRDATSFGYPPMIVGIAQFSGRPALEPLLDFDSNFNFKPSYLVTKWEIAKDGLSATMALRQGVKFHDGTDFNADAVKWNLGQQQAAKVIGSEMWKSIEVVDNYTVKLNLTQFDVALGKRLSTAVGLIISPTAFQKNGQDWAAEHPVGTGAYKLKSFTRNVSIIYEKFDGYWNKNQPLLDGIQINLMANEESSLAAFRAGEGDLIYTASPSNANGLQKLDYNVIAQMDGIIAICPDSANTDSPLSNQKVREAMEYAVDRETLAKNLGYGYWRASYQFGIPEMPLGYNADITGRKYDVAKAKQLLTEAGFPTGFKTTITFDTTHNVMEPMTAIQGYWKAVGIDVTLNQSPRAAYMQLRTTGWHNGWMDINNVLDPMYISIIPRLMDTVTRTIMFSTQRPPGYAEAVSAASSTVDFEQMKAKTQAVVRLLYDNASVFPIYSQAEPVPMSKKVQNTGIGTQNSFFTWTPESAWLSK